MMPAQSVAGKPDAAAPAVAPPPLWLLIVATATGPMAMNMFLPSMPGLVAVFGTDYATVQLTLTLYIVSLALTQLVYGPLSDRYGRRPVLIGGLLLYTVAAIGCALAWSIGALIAGRVLLAAGGCAGMVIGRAMLRDAYARDKAASMLATLTMVMAVAPAVSPAVGGHLDVWFGWRAVFVLLAACGAAVALAAVLRLPETHRAGGGGFDPLAMARSFRVLLATPAFLGYAGHATFLLAGWFSFLAGAPYVFETLIGLPRTAYGFYFLLISVAYILGNFVAARLSARLGVDRMMKLGLAPGMAGAALLFALLAAAPPSPWALVVPMAILSLGHGLGQPNAIAGAVSARPEIAGAASGLLGFLQLMGGAIGSFVVGKLLGGSALPMAAVILVCAGGSWLAYLVAVRANRT